MVAAILTRARAMSKKTLNKANLEKLGPEKLAALVMDLVQGNAALQRRARMELSAAQGPKDVAADLRKRFASLRRSASYVDCPQIIASSSIAVSEDRARNAMGGEQTVRSRPRIHGNRRLRSFAPRSESRLWSCGIAFVHYRQSCT